MKKNKEKTEKINNTFIKLEEIEINNIIPKQIEITKIENKITVLAALNILKVNRNSFPFAEKKFSTHFNTLKEWEQIFIIENIL